MKISIQEFRNIVADAVASVVTEAGKKIPAKQSDEYRIKELEKHIMGLPGFKHSKELDFSKPQGKRSRAKKQGASNIGPWTSESKQTHESKHKKAMEMLIRAICKEELSHFYKKLG